jgi:uncharacterized protein (TIGR00296 family)
MMSSQGNAVEPIELTLEEGVFLVRIARKAVETYVTEGTIIEPPSETPGKFKRLGMAFVTIERYSRSRELRGCIGFLQPVSPLINTVINAAIAAATEDPRFPPLTKEELGDIVIEVSVLSVPKPVKNINEIIIGRHGLFIYRGWHSGTLLPQVPIEYCWDRETFLAECCLKAGLDPDCWLDNKTRVYVYEARVFYEKTPRGEIDVRDLEKEFKEKCG